MSNHEIQHAGQVGGLSIIAMSAMVEWLGTHGISDAMVWIAILGLLLNVATALPGLLKTWDTLRERRRPRK